MSAKPRPQSTYNFSRNWHVDHRVPLMHLCGAFGRAVGVIVEIRDKMPGLRAQFYSSRRNAWLALVTNL